MAPSMSVRKTASGTAPPASAPAEPRPLIGSRLSSPRLMRARRPTFGPVANTLAFAGAYLLSSYLLLRPALTTALLGDDFEAPFANLYDSGVGLFHSLQYAWQTSFVMGDRSRVVSGFVGHAFSWAWVWFCVTFGVSLSTFYAATKFLTYLICAASVATFWWLVARRTRRPIPWRVALVLVSMALFGSVQLHGLWSNDPVQSLPLVGFAVTTLGFAVLSVAVWTTERPTWRRFALGAAVSLIAVSYYELNVGAVLGAFVIFAAEAWRVRGRLREVAHYAAGTALFCGIPAAWLIIARYTAVGDTYPGRQIGGNIGRAFLDGLIGSLPGSAWHLETKYVGGTPAIFLSAVIAALVAVATLIWVLRRTPPAASRSADPDGTRGPALVAAAAVAIFAVFAVALQTATLLFGGQVAGIGYVYTFYAVSATAVAFGFAAGAWWLIGRPGRRWRVASLVAALLFGVFLVVQGSFNARLRDVTNSRLATNLAVYRTFAAGVPESERCAAIDAWAQAPWPAYYKEDVVLGSNLGYLAYFGQLFCANGPRP
jgi:hypothetical protein